MNPSRMVVVLALGGTIAMAPGPAGVVPTLDADTLLAGLPGLAGLDVELTARTLLSVPGAALTIADLRLLADTVVAEIAAGAAGIVITQGTDTIEETAFFLDRTVATGTPVVVTGAMRPSSAAGADGPANLLAAIQVAASPQARGLGCVVVFGDEIHAARLVRKTHTTSPATFVSGGFGPLGAVLDGRPRIVLTPRPIPPLGIGRDLTGHRVAVLPVVLGDDGELLRRTADAFGGLVIAAMGAGHVPPTLLPDLYRLAVEKPVILASRTGSGAVLRHTYGFPGSESDLREHGLIGAGFLDPYKARILLHLLLANRADAAQISAAFAMFD